MLERFREAKAGEIATLLAQEERGLAPTPWSGARPAFADALGGPSLALIAEYKRASPSRGIIRQDLTVEDVALAYLEGGAAAMSILTEETWFQGHFSYLDRAETVLAGKKPILRKDFIFHPVQVRATAASRASAVLLIVRATPEVGLLRQLREEAERYGLECVVEVGSAPEVDAARAAGANIIQVNARNLETLEVDRQWCIDTIRRRPPRKGEIWIAASGISAPPHLTQARDAGFDACLVGSALMREASPGAALRQLLAGVEHAA